jgi:superfamily I DNA/RNA helicase
MTIEQEQIINERGHVVVTARAGTGKTTVVVERIRKAIADGVDPQKIVAITYTVAAAREIQDRLGVRLCHCGTLHSFAMRFIPPMQIATEEEFQRAIADATSRLKVNGITTKAIVAGLEDVAEQQGNLGMVIRHIRYELEQRGIRTFGMALIAALRSGNLPRTRVDLLVVDEMQDSASIDLAIYEAIQPEESLIVGDDLQSIFGFRGSSPRHFRRLLRDPNRQKMKLGQTFRFGPAIVEAANRLCDAGMSTKRLDCETSCMFVHCPSEADEVGTIERFLRERADTSQSLAVLTRYNQTVRAIADRLRAAGLEVKVRAHNEDQSLLIDCLRMLAKDKVTSFETEYLALRLGERFYKVRGLRTALDQIDCARQSPSATAGLLALGLSHDEAMQSGGQGADSLTAAEALEAALRGQTAQWFSSGIEVTTIHQAKGREWDHVCLAAAWDRANTTEEDLRLFYVAITRTRVDLLITCVGKPSRFIEAAGIPVIN